MGYGGLELALSSLFDTELAWYAEIDPHASKVLEARFPGVPNLGDLTALDWSQVEPVDALTAGYPCQPFSDAGPKLGAADARHLWPYIADALRVLRPDYLVAENVGGHLRRGFDAVLADLAALRFDAEWTMLRASDVGAPHARRRLFVVAHAQNIGHERPRSTRPGRYGSANGRIAAADTSGAARHGSQQQAVAAPAGRTTEPRERGGEDAWGRYAAAIARWERVLGRRAPDPVGDSGRLSPLFVEWLMGLPAGWVTDADGLSRNAQLKMLGNGVVPQQAAYALSVLSVRVQETNPLPPVKTCTAGGTPDGERAA